MASTWYYYNEQGERIEVTGGQLKGLAKAGRITPDTIIETKDGKTAPARKVKGLTFVEAVTPDTEVYGLSKPKPPVEVNPFTVAAPGEVNPFIGTSPDDVTKPVTAKFSKPLITNTVLQKMSALVADKREYYDERKYYTDTNEKPFNPIPVIDVIVGVGVLLLVCVVIGIASNIGGGGSRPSGSTQSTATEKLRQIGLAALAFSEAIEADNPSGMREAWERFDGIDVSSFSPAFRSAHAELAGKMLTCSAGRDVLSQTIRRGEDPRFARQIYHQSIQSFLDSYRNFPDILRNEERRR